MRWQDLTSPQLDAQSRDTVVVVPVAAIEQHSIHLPVSTDTSIANELSRRLDAACDDRLLVLPTFWLGCSRHHMDFPGTLSTELDHWSACVQDIVRSVIRHGFRKVMVLNCHGGNNAILNVTLEKLRYSLPEEVRVVGATYWHVAADTLAEVRESGFGGMGHACEMETSLMLVIAGHLVDMKQAEEDGWQPTSKFTQMEMQQGQKAVLHRTFKQLARHGGIGAAQMASAEKGEAFFGAVIQRLKELVEDIEADRV